MFNRGGVRLRHHYWCLSLVHFHRYRRCNWICSYIRHCCFPRMQHFQALILIMYLMFSRIIIKITIDDIFLWPNLKFGYHHDFNCAKCIYFPDPTYYKSILIFQKYIENDSFLTFFPYLSMPNSIISLDHNQDISVIGDSFMIQNVT